MAKVHPHLVSPSTSPKQETFTLWMKSLILSSNGCTVFDSNGQIVYRVDNYSYKCIKRIHKILLTVVKKKCAVLGLWDGYISMGRGTYKAKKRVFRARELLGIRNMVLGFLRGYSLYKVNVVGANENKPCEYIMENQISKPSCKIFDPFGGLIAEVKRKITTSGVVLGDDVLTMVVEPHIDHSLIMGLVVVFGLIQHKL